MPLRAAPPIMPAASAAPQAQKPAPEPAASPESRPQPPNDAALTDMAQRLEAALRRPMAGPQAPQPPQTRTEPPKAEPAAQPRPAAPFGAPPAQPAKPAPRPEHAPEPARPAAMEQKPASGKSMLDSLEQEMASLLGRPIGKE